MRLHVWILSLLVFLAGLLVADAGAAVGNDFQQNVGLIMIIAGQVPMFVMIFNKSI